MLNLIVKNEDRYSRRSLFRVFERHAYHWFISSTFQERMYVSKIKELTKSTTSITMRLTPFIEIRRSIPLRPELEKGEIRLEIPLVNIKERITKSIIEKIFKGEVTAEDIINRLKTDEDFKRDTEKLAKKMLEYTLTVIEMDENIKRKFHEFLRVLAAVMIEEIEKRIEEVF